jgi:hypothetical protein
MSTAGIHRDPSDPEGLRHAGWEYHVADADGPMAVEDLDAPGGLGWELCAVVK